MKLSIITINYNNATGLKKTMESVLSQTYTDFEYIIVDGASTDGSVETIQSRGIGISGIPQQVKWISEKDTGIFHAMNKGAKMASGEYLLFLNSGDFFYSKEVLTEVFLNQTYRDDFICARCAVSKNGVVEFITQAPEKFTFKDFYGTTLAHQSTFIKKSVFEIYGYYREDFKLKGDWEFFVRTIILHKCSTTTIDTILVDYNLDGVSASNANRALQEEEMQHIFKETILQQFVPDYRYYTQEIINMRPYYWLKKQKMLNTFVLCCYQIAKKIKK